MSHHASCADHRACSESDSWTCSELEAADIVQSLVEALQGIVSVTDGCKTECEMVANSIACDALSTVEASR